MTSESGSKKRKKEGRSKSSRKNSSSNPNSNPTLNPNPGIESRKCECEVVPSGRSSVSGIITEPALTTLLFRYAFTWMRTSLTAMKNGKAEDKGKEKGKGKW